MSYERLTPKFSITKQKLEALKRVIPEAFADGKINWQVLREDLRDHLEEEGADTEHFGLFWPGKREARRMAAIPSKGTLVPCPGEGIDEENTHNIFIEGENLEVLKILQKSYAGRIKMIYIDPPYNTGKDFVYEDDFKEPIEEYLRRTNQVDEMGKPWTTNTRADGRFHSKWLSMMYPRIILAKSLLSQDGLIVVSINDNEVFGLRMIMNELFGEENFLAQFVWKTDGNFDNQAKVKVCHEYLLAFARDLSLFPAPPVVDPNIPRTSKLFKGEIRNTIVKNGPKNPVSSVVLPKGFPAAFERGVIRKRKDAWPHYEHDATIKSFCLQNATSVSSGWSSKDILLEFIERGMQPIVDSKGQETTFLLTETGAIENVKKRPENQSHVISVLTGLGNTQSSGAELEEAGIIFDYPKPVELIKYIVSMNHCNDHLVLDFFAGAGTTAEAVLELNNSDQGSRKYICVQFMEPIEPETKAYKAGFRSIDQVCRKRLHWAAKKMKNLRSKGDVGFRSFRLATSAFNIWEKYKGTSIIELEKSLNLFDIEALENRDAKSILMELMLIEGFPLDSTLEALQEVDNVVYRISSVCCEHTLLICLDKKFNHRTIDALSFKENDVFVCIDSALSDQAKMRLADRCKLKTI